MRNIFVAGGKGLIGRAIVNRLKDGCHNIVVADPDLIEKKYMLDEFQFDGFVNCSYPKTKHMSIFMYGTELFAEHMKEKGGSIVNLASIYGVVGPCDDIYKDTSLEMPDSYAAIKGGIISHSRCMATRFGKHNVRVNCVSPGGVINGQPKTFVKKYCDRVPLGRMANPEDIAGVVAFLLSEDARYVTGQNIIVDGGLTAW